MTSQLASEDLADLRAEGLNPTDEDVIRLHALALRLTDGPETTAANAPRWATAGGVIFWEPTIAAWQWFEYAKTTASSASDEDWYFAYACANGRIKGHLEALSDEADIRRAVYGWLKTITATRAEVENAVYFVSTGLDDIVPEKTDLAKQQALKKTDRERERENYAAIEGLFRQAASATGLTADDILIQTPSRLRGMIYAAHIQAGLNLTRNAAAAHADYLATLNSIAKRLREERDARTV